jgi:hypothetical protein
LYLTQPRRPKHISEHIGRRQSCTTGHLRHLLRRGLVMRLDDSTYCLPFEFPLSELTCEGRARQSAARAILERLGAEQRVDDVGDKINDLGSAIARPVFEGLLRSGAIRRTPCRRYIRATACPEALPETAVAARRGGDHRPGDAQMGAA